MGARQPRPIPAAGKTGLIPTALQKHLTAARQLQRKGRSAKGAPGAMVIAGSIAGNHWSSLLCNTSSLHCQLKKGVTDFSHSLGFSYPVTLSTELAHHYIKMKF